MSAVSASAPVGENALRHALEQVFLPPVNQRRTVNELAGQFVDGPIALRAARATFALNAAVGVRRLPPHRSFPGPRSKFNPWSSFRESIIGKGTIEANTLDTCRLHLNHFCRFLGDAFPLQELTLAKLQDYVNKPAKIGAARFSTAISRIEYSTGKTHAHGTKTQEGQGMHTASTRMAAIFVDRTCTEHWIVRDPEGNFWIVPSVAIRN